MRVLVVALLFFGAGRAWAEKDSAVLVNLGPERVDPQLVDRIDNDVRAAGYQQHGDGELEQRLLLPPLESSLLAEESGRLRQAREAYENFQLKDAVAGLDEFDDTWRDSSSSAKALELLADRYLLGGLVRFAEGNESKARDNFRLSHRLRPELSSLSAELYRPAVVSLYASAVAANTAAEQLAFDGSWTPGTAELLVDGHKQLAGNTLSSGPHLLSLSAPGYQSAVYVNSFGESSKFQAALVPLEQAQALDQLRALLRSEGVQASHLHELAGALGVQLLILIGPDPQQPARVYRAASGELSPWLELGSRDWKAALRRGPSSAALAFDAGPTTAQDDEHWYATWWGGGLLAVGAGAAIGSALYFALSPGDSGNAGVTIDQWCIGSCQ